MKNSNVADKKLLASKIADISRAAEKYCSPQFSAFLDPSSAAFVKNNIYSGSNIDFEFFGGYEDAERVVFCAKPDWIEEVSYPIKPVLIKLKSRDVLTHRDYLGSILSLGITRDVLGDICIFENSALVFCKSDIADYIVTNLTKIGNKGVECGEFFGDFEKFVSKKVVRESINVASERIDAVICAAYKLSRSVCCELISQGRVNLNFEQCQKSDTKLSEGDLISVRGCGRIRFIGLGGMSKKGRLYVEIDRYV